MQVQRATDPKWRPCSGILHTSSAFSACCPVIKGERKEGRALHKVFLWFLPTAAFFFSLPFQILSIASINSQRQMFPHKMSGQVVFLISKDRRNQIQPWCNFTDFTDFPGVTGHQGWIVSTITGTHLASSINSLTNSIYILLPVRPYEKGTYNDKVDKSAPLMDPILSG